MKMKIPKTCKECGNQVQLKNNKFYCTINTETDIRNTEIQDIDSRPDWCPIKTLNGKISNLNYKEQLIVKSLSILFGGEGVFEDESQSDYDKITKGLRCCIDKGDRCIYAISTCPYVPDCQSGERSKLLRDALKYIEKQRNDNNE